MRRLWRKASDSRSKSVFQTNCIAYQPSATAAMTDDTPLPFDLPSVRRKKLTVDFDGGNQSSNGGLLLLREAERKLGVCGRLADAMPDRRDREPHPARDVRDGDGARLGDRLRLRGCHRPRSAAA